jgi:hypothetical protein
MTTNQELAKQLAQMRLEILKLWAEVSEERAGIAKPLLDAANSLRLAIRKLSS